ncbi:Oidioi.mRNA.OKI2018_I69.chr2.g4544.t1.cds [Oikopleura dioica]|uniref:Oidioi.mRNA.OKI2018_I69.chr2.g4544.t1.cds n=1 Tax=Oikopleura dioica TaxID=34765 RepID=A0ABN7T134_OIKDI|nr:Oidioi.mRNA.OKI2018_I69.chr2.g4544.t1.cds [Oikopleura dioica]
MVTDFFFVISNLTKFGNFHFSDFDISDNNYSTILPNIKYFNYEVNNSNSPHNNNEMIDDIIIDSSHYWLDENLEFSEPVPQEHVATSENIDCDYFEDEDDPIVYYFQAKPDGDWKECKEHDYNDHEHICVCMKHLSG